MYSGFPSSVVLWSRCEVGDISVGLSIGEAVPGFLGMFLGLPVVVGVDVLGLLMCWVGGLGRL